MNEPEREVFRGHFEECFKHLGTILASRAPKGTRGVAQTRKPLADFCEVTADSVTRWINETGGLPTGEKLLRLMCYLDLLGYRVIELERMQPIQRNFAELIGFKLLSSDQAIELLGFSNTSTLHRVLLGQQGASKAKDQKMWEMWKEKKEELSRAKEQAGQRSCLATPAKTEQQTLPFRQTAVINIMEGLLALLEDGPANNLSDYDLVGFKQSADMILRLSARLSALGARLIMSSQKGGG